MGVVVTEGSWHRLRRPTGHLHVSITARDSEGPRCTHRLRRGWLTSLPTLGSSKCSLSLQGNATWTFQQTVPRGLELTCNKELFPSQEMRGNSYGGKGGGIFHQATQVQVRALQPFRRVALDGPCNLSAPPVSLVSSSCGGLCGRDTALPHKEPCKC